jgi:CubicO group peptidase (beta-lactamase class C family)
MAGTFITFPGMRPLGLLLILCGAVQPLDAQRALRQRVDAYFAAAVAGGDFAGSVLIARGDSILVNKSYGLANIELNVPATPSTRYVIASLTKTLTAAAIIRLRDQGRLRLEDTLTRYLPMFPYASRMTLTQLLGHASGVANPDYTALFGRQVSLGELVDDIGKQPLQFAPGTESRYSSAGYNLLAAVIEKVTGQTYGAAIRELVLGPAGMAATGDASDGATVPALATPYVAGPGPSHARVAEGNYSADVGGGSAYATVGDLFRWARAVQTDRLFHRASLPYMYGWGQRKLAGGRWLEQTGLLDGWVSNLYVGLDSGIVVVVLGNHCTPTFGRWGRELAQVVMGGGIADSVQPLHAELPARETHIDPAIFEGTYKSDALSLRVTSSGGALYLEVDHWPVARYLAPSGQDRFVVGDFGMEMSFTRDAEGRVTTATWGTTTLPRQ